MRSGLRIPTRAVLVLVIGGGAVAAFEGAGLLGQARRQEAIARTCSLQVELLGEMLSLNQDVAAIHGKAQVLVRRAVASGIDDVALARQRTEIVERLGEVARRLEGRFREIMMAGDPVNPERSARMRQELCSARDDFDTLQARVLKATDGAASGPSMAASQLDEGTAAYRAFNEHLRNLTQEAMEVSFEGEMRLREETRIRIRQSGIEAAVLLGVLGWACGRLVRQGQRLGTVGRVAMDTLPHPALITDSEGRVIAWNPPFLQEVCTPGAAVGGQRVGDCLPPDLLEAFEVGEEALRRTGTPSTICTRHREEDRATVCLELDMKPLGNSEGSLEGILTLFRESRTPSSKGSAPDP